MQCIFHISEGSFYLISKYETGQYGHEAFDFIIMRNENQDTLQTEMTIAEPKQSNIYLVADRDITGIINTDSAAMTLTIMPESPCIDFNPCYSTTAANCTRTHKQHRFDCICNSGYAHVTDMQYQCDGTFIHSGQIWTVVMI